MPLHLSFSSSSLHPKQPTLASTTGSVPIMVQVPEITFPKDTWKDETRKRLHHQVHIRKAIPDHVLTLFSRPTSQCFARVGIFSKSQRSSCVSLCSSSVGVHLVHMWQKPNITANSLKFYKRKCTSTLQIERLYRPMQVSPNFKGIPPLKGN